MLKNLFEEIYERHAVKGNTLKFRWNGPNGFISVAPRQKVVEGEIYTGEIPDGNRRVICVGTCAGPVLLYESFTDQKLRVDVSTPIKPRNFFMSVLGNCRAFESNGRIFDLTVDNKTIIAVTGGMNAENNIGFRLKNLYEELGINLAA